jgi:hypothetical protein
LGRRGDERIHHADGPTQRLTVRNYPAPRVGNGIVNWQYSVVESQQQLVLQPIIQSFSPPSSV